uniref:No apical meristem-associated C-terminal domain-containing protein n=1 Tax=Oryza barthii TaxID=65489 RepID=A0A0D3HWE9_9ORYZ
MEKAREWYKKHNNQKPFTLEYMWKDLKINLNGLESLKRVTIIRGTRFLNQEHILHRRTKTQKHKEKRPKGQKAAKQRQKGKGAPSPLGDKPSQNMVLFHEAITTKAAALLKATEATLIGAEAKKEKAIAKKEKARAEKYQMYLKLMEKDTSTFSEAKLKRHENVLDQLARELAEE